MKRGDWAEALHIFNTKYERRGEGMELTFEGKRYEPCGYRRVKMGDCYLSNGWPFAILHATYDWGIASQVRLCVRPVTETRVIDGIMFEETGEVRQVQRGEWALDGRTGCVVYWDSPHASTSTKNVYTILRRVQ